MTEVVTIAAATTTATTITAALMPKESAPRRRRGVIMHDPEEESTASVIMQSKVKLKDKDKGILVVEPKPLKRQAKIEQDEAFARELEAKINANINWNELRTHLQIFPHDEDDVYTKATPLKTKVLVVDYQIHTENNKPYYEIIRSDGTHQLFISFISLLRNFDREDWEMMWKIVQERFESLDPKNFSDDFLLNAL
nr:hypothetical protein [Tanacetum cinerariifolium]